MREVVRYGWKTAQGRRNKRVNMIVTPAVQVVRPSLCLRYMYHCYTSTQNILYNINIKFQYSFPVHPKNIIMSLSGSTTLFQMHSH